MKEDIIEILKLIADKRMINTLDDFTRKDCEYQISMKKVQCLETVYKTLDLRPKEKELIDNLLAERDGINMEKVSLAYWAGMEDAVTILNRMGIIEL